MEISLMIRGNETLRLQEVSTKCNFSIVKYHTISQRYKCQIILKNILFDFPKQEIESSICTIQQLTSTLTRNKWDEKIHYGCQHCVLCQFLCNSIASPFVPVPVRFLYFHEMYSFIVSIMRKEDRENRRQKGNEVKAVISESAMRKRLLHKY